MKQEASDNPRMSPPKKPFSATTTLNEAVPPQEPSRPLYLRRVPESVWLRVHINALQSRMRLQDYLTRLMANSNPFPSPPRNAT